MEKILIKNTEEQDFHIYRVLSYFYNKKEPIIERFKTLAEVSKHYNKLHDDKSEDSDCGLIYAEELGWRELTIKRVYNDR